MGRLERLEQRRLDTSVLIKATGVQEAYQRIRESESVRYAIGAMQPIDPEYTKNTFAQGDRVKSQLKERVTQSCDYEYQGSTATDTHIKARSDIDLLMILTTFEWLDVGQTRSSLYAGDPAADMRKLRQDAVAALRAAFPMANCDDSRPKAIKISGASLSREVDVVPASWFNTNDYVSRQDKTFRGVKVFDRDSGLFTANLPFLHKARIEGRDQETRGGLRKAIRLMKTLMYDSEGRVTISSFNICGIAYNILPANLTVQRPRELAILEACHEYCQRLLTDTAERTSILVPDGHRKVFGDGPGATTEDLKGLAVAIAMLRDEILRDNSRVFKRLAESSVQYT